MLCSRGEVWQAAQCVRLLGLGLQRFWVKKPNKKFKVAQLFGEVTPQKFVRPIFSLGPISHINNVRKVRRHPRRLEKKFPAPINFKPNEKIQNSGARSSHMKQGVKKIFAT